MDIEYWQSPINGTDEFIYCIVETKFINAWVALGVETPGQIVTLVYDEGKVREPHTKAESLALDIEPIQKAKCDLLMEAGRKWPVWAPYARSLLQAAAERSTGTPGIA